VTIVVWLVLGVLVVAGVWLGLALVGVVRELSSLRARVAELESATSPIRIGGGLAAGRRAPSWSITTPTGDVVTSASMAGSRYLLVFADQDCRGCDEVVPAIVRAADMSRVPQAVIVGRGEASAVPEAWRNATAGVERADEVSEAFEVEISPSVFVIDEGGAIVARGGVADLRDVEALVEAGRGITIVGDAADG
jgi:peroxiredoxin